MALRTIALNVEDAAAGFRTFRVHRPEHEKEITTLTSDLFTITSSLLSLHGLSKEIRYRRNWVRARPDLDLVHASLRFTIENIFNFFHRLNGGKTTLDEYGRTWVAIDTFFWSESQYSLGTRLAKYKAFLRELGDSVKE